MIIVGFCGGQRKDVGGERTTDERLIATSPHSSADPVLGRLCPPTNLQLHLIVVYLFAMSSIPGAFPDEDEPVELAAAAPTTELVIDAKALREIERKEKDAQTQKKKSFRVIEAEPGAATSKTNPRIPPGNHLSRRFQVLDLGHRPQINLDTWQLTVTSKKGTVKLSLADIRALGEEQVQLDFQWVALTIRKYVISFSSISFSLPRLFHFSFLAASRHGQLWIYNGPASVSPKSWNTARTLSPKTGSSCLNKASAGTRPTCPVEMSFEAILGSSTV